MILYILKLLNSEKALKENLLKDDDKELVENLKSVAINKQLNFLIGSGTSVPAIPLMNQVEVRPGEDLNTNLTKTVMEVSKKIIMNDSTVENIVNVQRTYTKFLQIIVDLLNLSNARQTPKHVNIFTTNYDLFLENAADVIMRNNRVVFNDGANGYFKRVLDSSNYNRVVAYKGLNDNYIDEIPSISLIKPHGSVNWKSDDNDKIQIMNDVVSDPVIVKPTGYESQETFINNHFHEMLRLFQLELDKPQSVLIIIGFSFQDKHIGKMIKRAMQNPELMIYVFGYVDEDKGKYLKNISIDVERPNFHILTPKDFAKNHLSKINSDKTDGKYTFNLNNLIQILKK